MILAPLAQRRKAHRTAKDYGKVYTKDGNKDCNKDYNKECNKDFNKDYKTREDSDLQSNSSQGFDVTLFEDEDINLLKRRIYDVL